MYFISVIISFEFDFQEGPLINPRDPSVFSMIVYMNTPLVLLTSWKNGKTVHTDRYERHIPFQVMVEFDVQLRVKAEYYEVSTFFIFWICLLRASLALCFKQQVDTWSLWLQFPVNESLGFFSNKHLCDEL